MKRLIAIASCSLLLTACAANSHYQSENNPQQWQGQNISAVQKKWGSADQVLHTRSGMSYWVYSTSGSGRFNAVTTNIALGDSGPFQGQRGLQCEAIFKTDKNNIIIATTHLGSNCVGEWAPGK